MNLTLQRLDEETVGGLYIDGHWECFTLEDKDRHLETGGVKIPKETAIPRGKYRVIIDWSDKHWGLEAHILDVPQFEGIRFDIANSPDEIEGCIAVGQERDVNRPRWISKSRVAYKALIIKIWEAILKSEEVWIEIV